MLPEPSLAVSAAQTISSVTKMSQEAGGKLNRATSLGGTPTLVAATASGAATIPAPAFALQAALTVHGFTPEECCLLRCTRVLHLGQLTPTVRSWKRVADYYGFHVDFCSTVTEACALLQTYIRDAPSSSASSSPPSPGRCQLDGQLPTLTVDLDLGVTEQECAEQLYTLAPMRVLYLTSSKKGRAELAADSGGATSSTPVIMATSPSLNAASSGSPSQQAASSAVPFTGASVKQQVHYPCLRRCLMKPVKVRVLIRQGLELALQPIVPIASPISPSDNRGSESAWSPRTHDDSESAGSRSASRRASVSSTISAADLTSSSLPGTPSASSTPPMSSNARPSRIANVAQQHPLRSTHIAPRGSRLARQPKCAHPCAEG